MAKKSAKPKKSSRSRDAKDGKTKDPSVQQEVTEERAAESRIQPTSRGGPEVAKSAINAKNEVNKWLNRALNKGIPGLREEFMELKRYCPPDMNITTFTNNWDAGRNRYKDVPCQEKFRVVLKWPGSPTDYIHANYVATPISEKRFICTQGPLDCTIADFWHMVIQEDCDNVIMLCNIKEKGMDKCAQYWPLEPKEVQQYGDIQATCTSVQPMENDSTIRFTTINLKWKDDKGQAKERDVRHFQWVDWPDRGVPPCRLTTFELLSRVRGTRKPIVVHCSAGIGRTGSIVAIEFILERMQDGKSCEAMDEILKELRNQRPYSIQTDQQYLFVHRIILFYFCEKYGSQRDSDQMAKYKKFVEDYDKAVA